MYYVYLLECGDGSIYTGITNDLEKRLAAHKRGIGGSYTRARGARKILYSEAHPSKSAALKREAQIKRLKRSEKIALAGGSFSRFSFRNLI